MMDAQPSRWQPVTGFYCRHSIPLGDIGWLMPVAARCLSTKLLQVVILSYEFRLTA